MTDFERTTISSLARIEAGVEQLQKGEHDLELRMRTAEKRQWASGGAISLLSVLLAALGIHTMH